MADISPRVLAVQEALGELKTYVSNQPARIIPNRGPILEAIEAWGNDAADAPGRLRPLLDLDTIPSLAGVRHRQGQGAWFFLPIIVAWGVLGSAEISYQDADTESSFFVWWSGQVVGPATYSFVIAVLLVVIVALRVHRDMAANKADLVEEEFSKRAAKLCVETARLMEDNKPLETSAMALMRAADRLSSVGSSLSTMPADIKEYLAAAQTAGVAVAKLDEVTTRLSEQVESLTSSLGSAAGAVSDWDEKLAPVRETLKTLTKVSAESQARSAQLSEQLGTLISILPSAVDIATASGEAAQQTSRALPELAAATGTLRSALSALDASQTRVQELINSAHHVVAFLDDRIDGKATHHHWPPVAAAGGAAE